METLEESTAIVIVEAAAEVRKRERDIAELVGEAFAREQVISEQRQQIAELAASAAAHEKIPPSMMSKDLKRALFKECVTEKGHCKNDSSNLALYLGVHPMLTARLHASSPAKPGGEQTSQNTRNTAQVMHISCNQLMAQSWRRSFAPPLLSHEFHTFVIERHCWKIPSVVAGKMNNGPTMN